MRIFVTGNCGFIGSHLYNYLKRRGHSVIGIDNLSHSCERSTPSINADVRYYSDIEQYVKWSDVVMHLAAQIHVDKSITNPQETIDTNITGTLNVLEAVKKHNKEMVFASSSEIYGSYDGLINETNQLNPQSPYAASKVAADRLCFSYHETYGTKVSILRNFNTFGEYQNDTSYGGVIAIFTKQALAGKDITIYGDGTQKRDYMHIKDAIAGYMLCVEKKLYGAPVNIGTGSTIKIIDLAFIIKLLTKSKSNIVHLKARDGEVQQLQADIKLAESYGFVSRTNFEFDLANYINWYKNAKAKK